jgi:phenylalanyl-tRNA synthetase alpha subunit
MWQVVALNSVQEIYTTWSGPTWLRTTLWKSGKRAFSKTLAVRLFEYFNITLHIEVQQSSHDSIVDMFPMTEEEQMQKAMAETLQTARVREWKDEREKKMMRYAEKESRISKRVTEKRADVKLSEDLQEAVDNSLDPMLYEKPVKIRRMHPLAYARFFLASMFM